MYTHFENVSSWSEFEFLIPTLVTAILVVQNKRAWLNHHQFQGIDSGSRKKMYFSLLRGIREIFNGLESIQD